MLSAMHFLMYNTFVWIYDTLFQPELRLSKKRNTCIAIKILLLRVCRQRFGVCVFDEVG